MLLFSSCSFKNSQRFCVLAILYLVWVYIEWQSTDSSFLYTRISGRSAPFILAPVEGLHVAHARTHSNITLPYKLYTYNTNNIIPINGLLTFLVLDMSISLPHMC